MVWTILTQCAAKLTKYSLHSYLSDHRLLLSSMNQGIVEANPSGTPHRFKYRGTTAPDLKAVNESTSFNFNFSFRLSTFKHPSPFSYHYRVNYKSIFIDQTHLCKLCKEGLHHRLKYFAFFLVSI